MQKIIFATAVGASLAGAALLGARAAEDRIAIDNLVVTIGSTTYRVPRLEIEGSSLPAAELAKLFDGDEKAIDARLARFSAKRVYAYSITTERRIGSGKETGAYRDLVFEDIVAGRVGAARASGGEDKVETGDGGLERYVWGPLASKGADLRQFVHVAISAGPDKNEAIKPLIDEETIEFSTFESKRDNLVVKTGRLTLTGAKGRPLPMPLAKLFERLDKLGLDEGDADPTLLRDLVEALSSFEAHTLEARDIVGVGKGAPAEKPYSFKIARAFAANLAAAALGETAVEDFVLNSSDGGRVATRRFGLRAMELATLAEGAYPRLGHFELKGVDADLPDPKSGETARMKFQLENLEADFSNFRDAAPTKFAARLDRLAIDLGPRGDSPSTAQFVALGYRDLGFSAVSSGQWNEEAQEFVFAPTHIEGKDMGAVDLALTLGDVTGAAFSSTPVLSRAATLAISAKSLDLTLTGGGLVDRLLALEARQQATSVEKARADYAKLASAAVTELAGAGEKAKRIADAVAAYVMKPERLHLRLYAPKGVNALDALAKKPSEILESVDVEASAGK